jgi:hypothetical protein
MLKKEVFELPPGVLGDIGRNDPDALLNAFVAGVRSFT